MEGEKKVEPEFDLHAAANLRLEKLFYQRQLRELEIRAYAGVLQALRASGKPNAEKDVIIKTLRDFFNISEDRHKSEIRLLAYDDKLAIISKKLNGYDYNNEWAFLGQRVYVPLGPHAFSLYRSYPANILKSSTVVKDPVSSGRTKDATLIFDDDSDSDVELEWIESLYKEGIAQAEKPKGYAVAVETGAGNEEEIEEIEAQIKKRQKSQGKRPKSPDITDIQASPTKSNSSKNEIKEESSTKTKVRADKRKNSEEPPLVLPPSEDSSSNPSKKLKGKPRNVVRPNKKTSRPNAKVKFIPPKPTKKLKESSEETSSADEGENGPNPPLFDESSRVMSPVFSEVIRTSALSRASRGSKGGRGGRASAAERRRNNASTSPSKMKGGKSRPRTPNQKSAKMKNEKPSGSRRKSKLNEKLDYDEISLNIARVGTEKQWPPQSQYHETRNHLEENSRRMYFDNQNLVVYDRIGDSHGKDNYKHHHNEVVEYSSSAESLPVHFNHADMEEVTDGVFKRPLPPSKGPKHWEIKDAKLNTNHCYQDELVSDENSSGRGDSEAFGGCSAEAGTANLHMVNSVNEIPSYTPSTPPKNGDQSSPPSKKQRIKSPLLVNSNINPPNASKVPVFSTSLSSVSKNKRQNNKSISVVDSLNLHLPTSATASSLAASSNNRRPGTASGSGCSMFSNSSALIAGARGTAPGILQQQRKATPHILSNSKIHQRTFLPPNSPSVQSSNVSVNNSIVPISGPPVVSLATNAISVNSVAAAGQAVQIPASSLPLSVAPSNALPFPNFSTANSPTINLSSSGGVPIGHLNRSGAGANIIFVQKTNNGPTVGVAGATTAPTSIPLKTPPRAVILRRAQIPRQGNVMILDMQKNQLVPAGGQTSPILQTTRVLNAPGELSLVSIQPNASPKKATSSNQPPPTSIAHVSTQPVQNASAQNIQSNVGTNNQEFISIPQSSQIVHVTTSEVNNVETQDPTANVLEGKVFIPLSGSEQTEQVQEVAQDAQYAQIEAELMQMEQGSFEEIVYEEEVTTEIIPLEESAATQYIYTNDSIPTTEGEVMLTTQTDLSSHNTSITSGSSTDTASENEISIQQFESPENDSSKQASVTKVTLSPMGEAKIATEAISRALSLSKLSPAKKLTFTTSNATSLPTNFTIVSKSNIDLSDVPANAPQTQEDVSLQNVEITDKTSSVLLEDSTSTNKIVIEKTLLGTEADLTAKNVLQQQSQAELEVNSHSNEMSSSSSP